jgi:hypothetical protein
MRGRWDIPSKKYWLIDDNRYMRENKHERDNSRYRNHACNAPYGPPIPWVPPVISSLECQPTNYHLTLKLGWPHIPHRRERAGGSGRATRLVPNVSCAGPKNTQKLLVKKITYQPLKHWNMRGKAESQCWRWFKSTCCHIDGCVGKSRAQHFAWPKMSCSS